jgi:hypothetical protein
MTQTMTQPDFEVFRAEWLGDVRAGNPSTSQLGHRFARKLVTQWLDVDLCWPATTSRSGRATSSICPLSG